MVFRRQGTVWEAMSPSAQSKGEFALFTVPKVWGTRCARQFLWPVSSGSILKWLCLYYLTISSFWSRTFLESIPSKSLENSTNPLLKVSLATRCLVPHVEYVVPLLVPHQGKARSCRVLSPAAGKVVCFFHRSLRSQLRNSSPRKKKKALLMCFFNILSLLRFLTRSLTGLSDHLKTLSNHDPSDALITWSCAELVKILNS